MQLPFRSNLVHRPHAYFGSQIYEIHKLEEKPLSVQEPLWLWAPDLCYLLLKRG